ncbi:hypothetical protein JZ751_029445 [Albula glossodonta]|uniref:Uncharacterized protein n=1 Tax=Albula glossodonta TaxID=121402 RepID=A0A8T2P9C2_9TELE|nr:hypothetical protein JZ751_029445 [Albula glossodonta]
MTLHYMCEVQGSHCCAPALRNEKQVPRVQALLLRAFLCERRRRMTRHRRTTLTQAAFTAPETF